MIHPDPRNKSTTKNFVCPFKGLLVRKCSSMPTTCFLQAGPCNIYLLNNLMSFCAPIRPKKQIDYKNCLVGKIRRRRFPACLLGIVQAGPCNICPLHNLKMSCCAPPRPKKQIDYKNSFVWVTRTRFPACWLGIVQAGPCNLYPLQSTIRTPLLGKVTGKFPACLLGIVCRWTAFVFSTC